MIDWTLYLDEDGNMPPAVELTLERRNQLAEQLLVEQPMPEEGEANWTTTGDTLVLVTNNDGETFDVYECQVRRTTFVTKDMFKST